MAGPREHATAALLLDVEKMAGQGVKILKVSARGTGAGIAIRRKVIKRGAKQRRKNQEFEGLRDSKIVPGMIYNLFQKVVMLNEHNEAPSPLVFQILLFLEFCAGNAEKDEIKTMCWKNGTTDSSLWSGVDAVNKFLASIKVMKTVSISEKGLVTWE